MSLDDDDPFRWLEDVEGELAIKESGDKPGEQPGDGKRGEPKLSLEALADRIVDLILTRERRGKHYGTVVLAEGLAEMLPQSQIRDLPRDDHGHLSLGRIDLGKVVAQLVMQRYEHRTGRNQE